MLNIISYDSKLTVEARRNFDFEYNNHQIDSDQNRRF